jgi:ABC-2 type transport system ATP-binding protein
MNPSDFAIEVKDVKRSFRSIKKEEGLKGTLKLLYKPEYLTHEALKGVSFEIQKGEFTGLIGANGAGKTTLLKILSGLIPPTSGEATVLGFTPFERSIEFRKQISIVMGQKAQLWWDLPAIEAFDLIRALYQIPKDIYRKRVDELTSLLDVTKLLNTQIRRLSLGERMKMEVIGAILHLPKVIFLDEPTIGLDVLASKKLREFLRAHNQREGATIILTSHNMDDISELCKRVLLIKEGSLIFDGNPKRLTEQDECVLKVKLLSAPTLT